MLDLNRYRCPRCDAQWEDQGDGLYNDDCPNPDCYRGSAPFENRLADKERVEHKASLEQIINYAVISGGEGEWIADIIRAVFDGHLLEATVHADALIREYDEAAFEDSNPDVPYVETP